MGSVLNQLEGFDLRPPTTRLPYGVMILEPFAQMADGQENSGNFIMNVVFRFESQTSLWLIAYSFFLVHRFPSGDQFIGNTTLTNRIVKLIRRL